MPTILTSSQQTFVDITDQRKLSAYITSNLPKTQSENPNVLPHTYAPSWVSTNLTLTPVVFLDQTNVALNSSGLTITWKRKDGIRMDFSTITDELKDNIATNQELLEEYIRFKGALIELGKVGNAFTAELSNNELAFKENGQKIAYISNNSLVITNAEIRNKLSLGNETRGWFDFIPRSNGNLSIKWRGPAS